MASLITRCPEKTLQLAEHLWLYLRNTQKFGLKFVGEEGEYNLNIYTDASYGAQPHGCSLIHWGGAPLLWRSSKHTVASASTAEAELVEVLEGALIGESVRVVMEELVDHRARVCLHTDSSSALAIVTNDSGSWRTRHLRKRAHHLRTRVLSGDWWMRHVPGQQMPADLGTKVLSSDRFHMLRELIGMAQRPEDEKKKIQEAENPKDRKKIQEAETPEDGKKIQEAETPKDGKKNNKAENLREGRTSHTHREELATAIRAIILAAEVMMTKGSLEAPLDSVESEGKGVEEILIVKLVGSSSTVMWWAMIVSFVAILGMIILLKRTCSTTIRLGHDQEEKCSEEKSQKLKEEDVKKDDELVRRRSVQRNSQVGGATSSSGNHTLAAPERDPQPQDDRSVISFDSEGSVHIEVSRPKFYITPHGAKFHVRRDCNGLRNARHVLEAYRCRTCGPSEDRPLVRLWTIGWGEDMHTRREHADEDLEGEAKHYDPCLVCVL